MIPTGPFAVSAEIKQFLSPDDLGKVDLTEDYERGGVALNDSSQGLLAQNWRARVVGSNIMISAAPYATETVALTVPGVTEVAIAFDQLMSPTIAYMVGTQSYLWWYDSSIPGRVTTTLASDVRNPFLSMDDKRAGAGARNDILIVYLRGDTVYYRQQRDRFLTEYLLYAFSQTVEKITRVGLGSDLRFNVEVKLVSSYVPVVVLLPVTITFDETGSPASDSSVTSYYSVSAGVTFAATAVMKAVSGFTTPQGPRASGGRFVFQRGTPSFFLNIDPARKIKKIQMDLATNGATPCYASTSLGPQRYLGRIGDENGYWTNNIFQMGAGAFTNDTGYFTQLRFDSESEFSTWCLDEIVLTPE